MFKSRNSHSSLMAVSSSNRAAKDSALWTFGPLFVAALFVAFAIAAGL